ncbi:MAG: putative Ig domain-containing protein [Dehalococcoidia bacterium]|nr:putative Ig domain-containing protein [Dehalococcoidia bacterium]MDD5647611.1 putative Ig domain-containing protein [Dehalococcoidia bacterium]
MKIHKAALYIALLTLLAVVIIGGACAAGQVTNPNAPVISSLVAEHTNLYPLGNTVITCSAVSPQGLPLNYKWVCSEGTITGNGPSITYEAPKTYGDFHIMATVDDAQGNTASQTVKVTVIVRDPSKCCR